MPTESLSFLALIAESVEPRQRPSSYPEPFRSRVAGRTKRVLGDKFGLTNFGVNLTSLAPGGMSALMHRHSRQDEFIYVIAGYPTLVTDEGDMQLAPGMCAGFPRGGRAHHIINRQSEPARYLEIGDRSAGDEVEYPQDDLVARLAPDGIWIFTDKNGRPW